MLKYPAKEVPLETIVAAMETGHDVKVTLFGPISNFSGIHMDPGESAEVVAAVRITMTGKEQ